MVDYVNFDTEFGVTGSYVLASDYESLKADRDAQQKRADALAVENAYLKDVSNWDFKTGASEFECTSSQGFDDDDSMHDAVLMMLEKFETPATSAALEAI